MKKASVVISVALGLFLGFLVVSSERASQVAAQAVISTGSATQSAIATTSATLNLDITPYLGFDCIDFVDLGVIPVYGNAYGQFTCSVISNSLLGYNVSVTQANSLASGSGVIQPLAAKGQLNQYGTEARYGLNSSVNANGNASDWLASGTLLEIDHPVFTATGEDFSGRIGVSIGQDANLPVGTYMGTFTLTLSAIDSSPTP